MCNIVAGVWLMMSLLCILGSGMMLWWWHKLGKATRVYIYFTIILLGIAIGSTMRILILYDMLPEVYGVMIPIMICCGVYPMLHRMVRRAWMFAHSTDAEIQEELNLMVCPVLGTYCAALGRHAKEVHDVEAEA